MKGMCDFLSRGFACLAVALMILSGLAMPTQGVRANDPSPAGTGHHYAGCMSCLSGSCYTYPLIDCAYACDYQGKC